MAWRLTCLFRRFGCPPMADHLRSDREAEKEQIVQKISALNLQVQEAHDTSLDLLRKRMQVMQEPSSHDR